MGDVLAPGWPYTPRPPRDPRPRPPPTRHAEQHTPYAPARHMGNGNDPRWCSQRAHRPAAQRTHGGGSRGEGWRWGVREGSPAALHSRLFLARAPLGVALARRLVRSQTRARAPRLSCDRSLSLVPRRRRRRPVAGAITGRTIACPRQPGVRCRAPCAAGRCWCKLV